MYIGSENQFRNLYVLNSTVTTDFSADLNTDGNIKESKSEDKVCFQYKDGQNVLTTDVIKKGNVKSVVFTTGKSRKTYLSTVTLDGDPIVGQDYVLNVTIRNYVALGDDSTLVKFGAIHVTSKIAKASDFYLEMAKSLARNFSREATPLINVYLKTASGKDDVFVNGVYTKEEGTAYTGILIEECAQTASHRRGISPVSPVNFEVTCGTILKDGEDTVWGTATDPTMTGYTEIKNGYDIADMEWFYHGVRADMYHEATYPDNFEFTPKITNLNAIYNTIDIHFYYEGDGVDAAKSEKTITLVGDKITKGLADIISTDLGVTTIEKK